ncbi:MAG: rhodanese-like domain-containing protein [Candidatus Lambdaproteobacteria bacterium]|nr:rhodanese-like domain-containing protein [Candidatus Lambdaproteobacteria bacterium]
MSRSVSRVWLACALLLALAGAATLQAQQAAPAPVKHISVSEARQRLAADKSVALVDVRTPGEFTAGHIPGARLVELARLEALAPAALPDKDQPLLVYCQAGPRAKIAADSLARMGYRDVSLIDGSYIAWTRAGYAVSTGN